VRLVALALTVLALVGCSRTVVSESAATAAEEELAVVGASMEPTLHCAEPGMGCRAENEDVVVVRDERRIERREIIAFQVGPKARQQCGAGGLFVKRVIAVAGDEVSFRDGGVHVNGVRLRERNVNGPTDPGNATRVVVPPRHVFVMGDNRAQSCDSRVWGPLAVRRVVGVAFELRRGSRRIPLP
jgi:signal peptidase I